MMIKVISECFVKPKHEVEAAKERHYLGPTDLNFLHWYPIQKGLLFSIHQPSPPSSSSTLSDLIYNLKSSLSIALDHFYPLAGRFSTEQYPEEQACAVFTDCNKGPGARLIHAAAPSITKSDILSPYYDPTIVPNLFDLGEKFLNFDCFTRPLLSIQVTELADGVFIGFSMSHSVGDGTSFLQFISMLSEIYCSESDHAGETSLQISQVPVFTYKPWSSNLNRYDYGPIIKIPYLDIEEFITRYDKGPLRSRIFEFSSTSVAMLKTRANHECAEQNISSFQALSALVWRSITKARRLSPDQETACNLMVNARSRLHPPISENYFGNYISRASVISNVDELLTHDLGWAAVRIHECIAKHDSKHICDGWKALTGRLTSTQQSSSEDTRLGPNSVIIAGSARFDMYGPEFGLGRAVAVRMGYANKTDGKVTANPGCEGGGSVDLEISLRPENMDALEADEEFMSFVSSG